MITINKLLEESATVPGYVVRGVGGLLPVVGALTGSYDRAKSYLDELAIRKRISPNQPLDLTDVMRDKSRTLHHIAPGILPIVGSFSAMGAYTYRDKMEKVKNALDAGIISADDAREILNTPSGYDTIFKRKKLTNN